MHTTIEVLTVSGVDWLSEEHDGNHEDADDDQEHLDPVLPAIHELLVALTDLLQRRVRGLVLEEHHVDEGDEEVGGAVLRVGVVVLVRRVGVVRHPFEEYHENQVSEEGDQEDHLWDDLENDVREGPLQDLVPHAEAEAEEHVGDGDDDGELHLEGVEEGDLVGGEEPGGVHSQVVGVVAVLRDVARVQHERILHLEGEGEVVPVVPGAGEYADGLAEDVVVDEAGVDGEGAHHGDDVAPAEEDGADFVVLHLLLEGLLPQDHEEPEEEEDDSVAKVAEHDGEEEGERGDRVHRRVHLHVRIDAVRVDEHLVAGSVLVGPVERWRRLGCC